MPTRLGNATEPGRCARCLKSALLCVCSDLVPIDNRTKVHIIQHPRERSHPLGTARFAALALANAELTTWGPREAPTALDRLATRLPERTALLYPHPAARDVGELSGGECPEALIVLDGTWHHAHTLYRAIRWLTALPHLKIQPARPSGYRTLRREPAAHCISTVEAIVAALRVLEPATSGWDTLLDAFDRMVTRQLPHATGRSRPRRRRRRPPPGRSHRAIPKSLRDLSALVVVYGECVTEQTSAGQTRHPVYWSAVRPSTGEVFASYVRAKSFVPTRRHLEHMGLSRRAYETGSFPSEVDRAWKEFCHPDDHLVAWNRGSLDFDLARRAESRICLKTAWCNFHHRAAGHLQTVADEVGTALAVPPGVCGRAALRLAQTVAVLDYLRARLPDDLTSNGGARARENRAPVSRTP